MSFESKVVVIVGGSAGIGAVAALSFAKKLADVAIVGRDEDKLGKIAEKCSQFGKSPLIIKADVSKDEDVKLIINQTVNRFGRIDVLVNNAGIIRDKLVTDATMIETFDEVMNTNLRPVVLMTSYALPWLIKTKGNIINISSVLGCSELYGHSAYCTSKGGLINFSKVAALELAQKGVRVNIVSPGPCETDLFKSGDSKFTWEEMRLMCAMKRVLQPDEVVNVIEFLASDLARGVTGANYVVDCGYLLSRKV